MTAEQAHAEAYHRLVHEVAVANPKPDYLVWSWEEMPEANRELLYEASRRFLAEGEAEISAEQLAIALRAEAARLYERTSSSSNMAMKREEVISVADRIADHAVDARALGVRHFNEVCRMAQRITDLESARDIKTEALLVVTNKLTNREKDFRDCAAANLTLANRAIVAEHGHIEADEARRKAEARLAKVREVADRWDHLAVKQQLLEALDDQAV